MGSGGDISSISVICDTAGVVAFQSPLDAAVSAGAHARASQAGDGWSSNGDKDAVAPAVGQPLVKTYWFDHLDCDVRELQQIIRRAGSGRADRVRVWLRVNEHQLVRADLTVTPLLDASGATRHVLVRTEPTRAVPRKREDFNGDRDGDGDGPSFRAVRLKSDGPSPTTVAAPDLLAANLPVPLLRIDLPGGTVLAVNDAFAAWVSRDVAACRDVPLSELVDVADRGPLAEVLAAIAAPANRTQVPPERRIDVRLIAADARPLHARLTLLPDLRQFDANSATVLVVARDVTAERQLAELMTQADELARSSLANGRWLARLDKLIDAAPVGLALYEAGQLVRSNPSFDAPHGTAAAAAWIDALAADAARQRATVTATHDGQSAAGFWIRDDHGDLVGATLTSLPLPVLRSQALADAIRRALGGSRRVTSYTVAADDALVPLDEGGVAASNVESVFDAATVRQFRKSLAAARNGEEPVGIHVVLRDGGARHATLVRAGDGSIVMLLFDEVEHAAEREALQYRILELEETVDAVRRASVDPSHVEQIQRQAIDRHERLAQVVDAVGAGTFSWDIEAGRVEADARCLALLAVAAPHANDPPLTPATLLAAASPGDRERFERTLFDAMSAEGDGRVDLGVVCGRDARPVRIVGTVIFEERDASRDPSRLTAVVLDRSADLATQATLAELGATLKLRTAELNAIFEALPDPLRLFHDGVVRHNEAASNVLGKRISASFAGDRDAPAARALAGESSSAEVAIAAVEGAPARVVQSYAAPVWVDGRVVGAVAVERDLTDVRALSARVAEREQEIAGFFQNTGVGVVYLDAGGSILDLNPQFSVLLGNARADLIGKPLVGVALDEDRATLQGQIDAVLSGELTSCSAELRLKRRGGAMTWARLTVAPRHGAAGERSVVALVQDVNDLRVERDRSAELTASLASVRQRYELIASTGAEAFVLLDASLRVVEANDAARNMLRLPSGIDGDAFEAVALLGPDGTAVSSSRLPWNRALRGKPNKAELRLTYREAGAAGATPFIVVECEAAPAPRRQVIVHLRDISARHGLQEELQKAYARIVEAHTLLQQRTQQLEGNFVSAVQQLGAAAAAAAPAARAMSVEARMPPEMRASAQQLVDALRVHGRLVQHYTDSTAAAATFRTARADVEIHALVQEAQRLVSARFNVAGRLTARLDATRSTCRVDGAMVRHAFWSLLAHAASQASRAPATIRSEDVASADGAAVIRVSVAWPGKSFHTAEVTLARSFVEAEGGAFEVATADGTTTAVVTLPLETATAGDAKPPVEASVPLRVLLIEDHDSTARVLTRQLTRLGCEVTPAATLAAADASLQCAPTFGLLVCDLGMPDGSAIDFVRRVTRRAGAALPAIALRGYGAPDDNAAAMRSAGFVAQLTKPVDLNALATAINQIAKRS